MSAVFGIMGRTDHAKRAPDGKQLAIDLAVHISPIVFQIDRCRVAIGAKVL